MFEGTVCCSVLHIRCPHYMVNINTCALGFTGRLADFIVTVSNTSFPVSAAQLVPPEFVRCGQFPGSPGVGGTGTVTCSPQAINGRFVFISLPQPRSLMMCEVEVRYDGKLVPPTWLSNHMPGKVWGEITYPFPNFNGCTFEVREWISNFIPHFSMGVIIYSYWD